MANYFGKFLLTENAMTNSPEVAFEVLQFMRFVPLRVGPARDHPGQVVCLGYSPLFDDTPDATNPPRYDIIVGRDDDGKLIDVKAEKVQG